MPIKRCFLLYMPLPPPSSRLPPRHPCSASVIRDSSCRPNHHNRFLSPFILRTIPGLYIRCPSQRLVLSQEEARYAKFLKERQELLTKWGPTHADVEP
jgi:hypothetical protein